MAWRGIPAVRCPPMVLQNSLRQVHLAPILKFHGYAVADGFAVIRFLLFGCDSRQGKVCSAHGLFGQAHAHAIAHSQARFHTAECIKRAQSRGCKREAGAFEKAVTPYP